ncbi:ABC transporter substrate-binding protein [Methylicorpusculum sp.]|uniref:ABC transporter substrate-binding protein n=1 Tax=Methylicorpusculum sp. TaxID=2713644 RepID=UPI00272F87BD|nr:ABC transporter substrate-binding protein [Methylicorpusculum sp.]MDP2178404.1 ABC transporter substrate-binding protein [Methylicorpusculum sp.]MDP3530761.1 ABC transporter substrate-binding protein [Methylicorpusculum sp.]MDZ4154456.1 ABC transporter substrate-binding protein [Methylicorpusculum sp.]
MSLNLMSSNLSMKAVEQRVLFLVLLTLFLNLAGCDLSQLNNPYSKAEDNQAVLYSSFTERPKHLDPAVSYSANEYVFIGNIYEPPFQYHYLKRPYELEPLTAEQMPSVLYLDSNGRQLPSNAEERLIQYTDYVIQIKPGILYQPHPALARSDSGAYLYHQLTDLQLHGINTLNDFEQTGTRELTAEDYVYQIKRMATAKIQSPISELMKNYISGFAGFYEQSAGKTLKEIRTLPLEGVVAESRYTYRIRIKGKYPQFIYWLAMPFFAPMPWEADIFYDNPLLTQRNITLDWYPIGTGPFQLQENNPNRRMVMVKNPNFHDDRYPDQGEEEDGPNGLLADAGKKLPFIEKVVFTLEKETIPTWSKFLQGYYDVSGISSDSFDQVVQFSGTGDPNLTADMQNKGIQLQKAVSSSIFYIGFNMLDATLGRNGEKSRKLRQAISIAIDYEEFISIFMNGRGISAHGALPPGIFGYAEGKEGVNPYVYDWVNGQAKRKDIQYAQKLMKEAGYPGGVDSKTGQSLILYLDTPATSIEERPRMNWFRKQLKKLGIKLVIRGTDYNRFQQKMRAGNAQIFMWGWNADYPDPENFFFLLYGPNAKVAFGGENAGNYQNPKFDRLFRQMRNLGNNEQRYQLIQQLQNLIRHDAPWLFGLYPEDYVLHHGWYTNVKPNLMANNRLKYHKIDPVKRKESRQQWNAPVFWPLGLFLLLLVGLIIPAVIAYRRKIRLALND